MNKRSGFLFIFLGILSVLFFALIDRLGIGDRGKAPGAAQFLGIEFGIMLILVGIGLVTTKFSEDKNIKGRISNVYKSILNLPPLFWVVITFLTLYFLFFVSPMFLSKIRIQYFNKYIPDAWTSHIGFDIETTVTHISDWLTKGNSPYSDGIVPYTPLALAIFTPFLILGYPGYYKLLTAITIFSYILATFLIPLYISSKKDYGILMLFGIMGLFSYGFQFELERGQFNMIAFALCLLAIYIFHYQHKFRYFAYLLFSLAVQLKLYPAIFIIMFIKDWRDWKNNIRRIIGLAIFNFSLLFVLGYQLFIDFTKQITSRQLNLQSSRFEDLSISGFTYSLSESTLGIPAQYANLIGKSILVLFGVIILAIVFHLYKNKKTGLNPYLLLVCTIGALVIPTASFDYKLPLLVAPMIIMLNSLPTVSNLYKKAILIVTIIIMTAAYWSTLYPYDVKGPILARNSPALLAILFAITIMYFMLNGSVENINTKAE